MIALEMQTFSLALIVVTSLAWFGSNASADPNGGSNNARSASRLYRRYCVSCHGTDGKAKTSKGKFSHARDLTNPQWQTDVSDERIFNSIMNGRNVSGNMPAFADKLNEEEASSLVSFVRKLKGPAQ